jgi:para-nitrobenzyl esterase
LAFYQSEEREGPDSRLGHLEGRMETDIVFRCPANNLATLLSARGWPVWRYEFDVGTDDGSAEGGLTSHAAEISYIMERKPLGSGSRKMFMQDHWVYFAKTGNPNKTVPNEWARFIPRSKVYMAFDRKGGTARSELRSELCALTDAI